MLEKFNNEIVKSMIVCNGDDLVRYYNKFNILSMEIVKGIYGENVYQIKYVYKHSSEDES